MYRWMSCSAGGLVVAVMLSSCSQMDNANWFATVNGIKVSHEYVNFVGGSRLSDAQEWQESNSSAAANSQIVKDILLSKVLVHDAVESGFSALPAVKQELLISQDTLIAQLYAKHILEGFDVTEAQLRDEYEKLPAPVQYRLKFYHFLEPASAQEILDQGVKGQALEFALESAASAQEESPWMGLESMDQNLRSAVSAVSTGEIAQVMVPSGEQRWSLIQVLERQVFEKAGFEDMTPVLEAELKQRFLKSTVNALAAKAHIEFQGNQRLKENWYE